MGVFRYLKEQNSEITIVGCQPTEGSRIPGSRRWHKAYLPKIFEPKRVDRVIDIAQGDAEAFARTLASNSGLHTGASAAGASWAAQRVAEDIQEGVIVTVLCDRGSRYLSSDLFDGDHPELGPLEAVGS